MGSIFISGKFCIHEEGIEEFHCSEVVCKEKKKSSHAITAFHTDNANEILARNQSSILYGLGLGDGKREVVPVGDYLVER